MTKAEIRDQILLVLEGLRVEWTRADEMAVCNNPETVAVWRAAIEHGHSRFSELQLQYDQVN